MSSLENVVIFLGPPGSGKGTLSHVLQEKLGWEQLSTGDLCRKHIAEGTEVGRAIDFAIKSGKLVSDSLVSQMVDEWFASDERTGQTAILDGYPRTVNQAQLLDQMLKTHFPDLKLNVVLFDIPDEVVIARLSMRYICSLKECQTVYSLAPGSSLAPKKQGVCDQCGGALVRRPDDQEESVKTRLKMYHQHVKNLLDFYKKIEQSVLVVNANQSIDRMFETLKEKMGARVA